MKTLFCCWPLWLPLAACLAQTPPRDLDPVVVGGSNPYPPRGTVDAIVVQDGLAYCAMDGFGLAVFDVRDPAHPTWLSAYEIEGGDWSRARSVAVFGTHVIVAPSLSIFDVKNPTEPRLVSRVSWAHELGGAPAEVAVVGHYAYVAFERGLQVIDLSDPARPQPLGQIALGWNGSTDYSRGLAVAGDYAYVSYSRFLSSRYESGLQVINISDPRRLAIVVDHPTPGDAGNPGAGGGWAVAIQGAHAFVADGQSGLVVLDISDPTAPRRVGGLPIPDGAMTIALAGNYAHVGGSGEGRIHTIDVSDPPRPVLLASTNTGSTPGHYHSVAGLATSGEHLYAAAGRGGLRVLALRDPAKPQLLGAVETDGFPYDMVLRGHHAIVAEGWSGLQIIDVSDPNRTRRVGSYPTDGEARHVAVQGDFAYTGARRWDESVNQDRFNLEIFDLSAVANPRLLGRFQSAKIQWVTGLSVSGGLACLVGGGETNWLEIVDVSNPASPASVSAFTVACPARAVVVQGAQAYVATDCGVEIVDVQDPASPKPLSRVLQGSSVDHLALAGNLLCLSAWTQDASMQGVLALSVVDVGNPAAPRTLGNLAGVGGKIVVGGDRAYVFGYKSVRAVDLTHPAQPRWVATTGLSSSPQAAAALGDGRLLVIEGLAAGEMGELWSTGIEVIDFNRWANPQRLGKYPLDETERGSVAVSGNYACVTSGRYHGPDPFTVLEMVDVSDPTKPLLVGTNEVAGSGWGVAVGGTRAYLASDIFHGLQIIDISNPAFPTRLGGIKTGGGMLEIALSGNFIYVADGGLGLSVIDVSNPASPTRVGGHSTSSTAYNVAVWGNLAYVSTVQALEIIDITTPSNPTLVSTVSGLAAYARVAVFGNYACIAKEYLDEKTGAGGFVILDVTNPAEPREVSRVLTRLPAVDVAVEGNFAYVLTTDPNSSHLGSVEIVDVSDPANPRRVGGNSSVSGYHLVVSADAVFVAGNSGLTILNSFVPLRLEPPVWRQGTLRLSIGGPIDWNVRVQRSSDLATWHDWQTVTLGGTVVELADPQATSQARGFYRAVAP